MKRAFTLFAGLALTAAIAAPVVSQPGAALPMTEAPTTGDPRLQQAHEAIAKRDFSRADALFKQLAGDPASASAAYLGLAESARVRGDAAAAQRWLSEALRVGPRHAPTLLAWARWHYSKAEFPKAEEFLRRTLDADPRSTSAMVDLAGYHLNIRGQPAEAETWYRRAVELNPKLAGAQYALGVTLTRLGKADEAIGRFEEAARLSPGNPLPLQAQALAVASKGDREAALKLLDAALAAQPRYYAAQLDKADLLLAMGRPDAALAEYRAVTAANPKVIDAHLRHGIALQQLNRVTEAMTAYLTILTIDGDHVVALNNLAWLAADRPDIKDRGLAWAQKAAKLAPQEPRVQGTLAYVHHRRGETPQALKLIDAVLSGPGKALAEPHYLRGIMLADSGDAKGAAAALREALRLNPKFAQAADADARLRKLGG